MQGFGDSDDLFTLLNTGSERVSSLGFAIRIAVTRLLVTINLKFIPETCQTAFGQTVRLFLF